MQRSNQFKPDKRVGFLKLNARLLMDNADWLPLYAKLADRLSDSRL